MHRVVEGLDAEPVATAKSCPSRRPKSRTRTPPGAEWSARRAAILEEVQRDLGVRLRPERVALTARAHTGTLEVVELAVGHDAEPAILADDGLIAGPRGR